MLGYDLWYKRHPIYYFIMFGNLEHGNPNPGLETGAGL